MARYRKIDTRMWGDAKFSALSSPGPSAKYLWIFLLTGPHTTNVPGLFRVGEMALAEELGWTLEAFREAFRELFAKGLVQADWKSRVVWIPNVMKYDQPENPNVVKSWHTKWDEIPECSLKIEAYKRLKAFTEGLGEGFAKGFAEGCGKALPKGMANPEPEPEPEPEPGESPPENDSTAKTQNPKPLSLTDAEYYGMTPAQSGWDIRKLVDVATDETAWLSEEV